MINIANFLLTRKCNISCHYCRLSGNMNYDGKPEEYDDKIYYYQNEKHWTWWRDVAIELHNQNPNVFFILYGGEPLIYKGLPELVNCFNDNNFAYTIISNSTPSTDNLREELLEKTYFHIRGYTASVDPGFEKINSSEDSLLKSNHGYRVLKELIHEGVVDDPVAEMTCDIDTIHQAEETIKKLSDEGIWSDLTTIDHAKNKYYDFSNVEDGSRMVPKNEETFQIFNRLMDSDYKIHMKKELLPKIWGNLPADMDCHIGPDNLHNVTIDADGRLRLCLRIRGVQTPKFEATSLFNRDRDEVERSVEGDKRNLCRGCMWTCMFMSQMDPTDVLDHSE